MSATVSGLLTIGVLAVLLAVCYHPLGAWMARVYGDQRQLEQKLQSRIHLRGPISIAP